MHIEEKLMPEPIRIDLALQGGGAHGAFTWGVLDRLLEGERLQIDGISGTSAGAMNAVVLAHCYQWRRPRRRPARVRTSACNATPACACTISAA